MQREEDREPFETQYFGPSDPTPAVLGVPALFGAEGITFYLPSGEMRVCGQQLRILWDGRTGRILAITRFDDLDEQVARNLVERQEAINALQSQVAALLEQVAELRREKSSALNQIFALHRRNTELQTEAQQEHSERVRETGRMQRRISALEEENEGMSERIGQLADALAAERQKSDHDGPTE